MGWLSLLNTKNNDITPASCPFVTNFSSQHSQDKSLFQEHWGILKRDPVLGPTLPEGPKIVFRRAHNLRDKLAPNVDYPPTRVSLFNDLKGYFPCNKCINYKDNGLRKKKMCNFTSRSTGRYYTIDSCIRCNTTSVVYFSQHALAKNNTSEELQGG